MRVFYHADGRRPIAAHVLTVVAALSLVSCNGESPIAPSSSSGLSVADIVTSASSGAEGALRDGSAPPESGGPTLTVSGNQTVINGGTLLAALSASSSFNTIYVVVAARTLGLTVEGSGGIGGYYEIRLPTTATGAGVLLTFPQQIPLNEFELLFAVADPSGRVGPFASLSTQVTSVGAGDVQVTLSWDADADVDLHVVEPSGEEIYYAHRQSASSGELDLDSNAGCAIDGVRNENITWPVGAAPRGQYIVRVDYWSSCGVERTNFTVRIFNSGSAQVFTGSFTGSGDMGGRGSGQTIATFERRTGPAAGPARVVPTVTGPEKQLRSGAGTRMPAGAK